jgi:hypothetical protein
MLSTLLVFEMYEERHGGEQENIKYLNGSTGQWHLARDPGDFSGT